MTPKRTTKTTRQRAAARKPKPLGRSPDDIWQRNPEVIKRFLHVQRDYEQLCAEVEYILLKRITDQTIETSASRAKTLNSFLEKLPLKQYDSPFDEITDLAGVRVVCLYHSDIAKVAEIIRSEFVIAEDVDKLDELRVDQF